MRPAALLLLAVSVPAALAQSALVVGTVVEAGTVEPLPAASVFAAGTTRGDATDGAGWFAFSVPAPGTADVTATMLGYETAVQRVVVGAGDTVSVSLALRPVALALAEVDVVEERSAAWHEALDAFRRQFLGATPNAEATTLANPHVLQLVAGADTLRAVATAPLVVRNGALRYGVVVHDLAFAADGPEWGWDGALSFTDLCPSPCPDEVREARRAAYRGSLAHFLRAVAAGRAEAEGFAVERVARPGAGVPFLEGVRRLFRPAPSLASVVERHPWGWSLPVEGALRVVYDRERDPRLHLSGLSRRPGAGPPQVSWLAVEGGRLDVGPDGVPLDQAAVRRYGYWDWERVADLLPLDYEPDE